MCVYHMIWYGQYLLIILNVKLHIFKIICFSVFRNVKSSVEIMNTCVIGYFLLLILVQKYVYSVQLQ